MRASLAAPASASLTVSRRLCGAMERVAYVGHVFRGGARGRAVPLCARGLGPFGLSHERAVGDRVLPAFGHPRDDRALPYLPRPWRGNQLGDAVFPAARGGACRLPRRPSPFPRPCPPPLRRAKRRGVPLRRASPRPVPRRRHRRVDGHVRRVPAGPDALHAGIRQHKPPRIDSRLHRVG